ncbi:MAG: endonuclease [Gelidibacter sp.]
MKKNYITLILLIATSVAFAQIPAGYYNSATGTGYTLKTQLKNIIDNTNNGLPNEHIATDQGYNALDVLYATSDRDIYYENDNTILDLYSENPNGSDPYNYSYGSDECGNYNSEGDCYNKEHVIPQSAFNDATPMRSDGHQVIPTDGRVNGFRSNYPYGVVGTLVSQSGISNPTLNGSKLGNNLNSGYSAGYTGIVFEPIDEFKGDIARIYFYFVTRYQSQVSAWSAYDMFDGSSDKVLADPFLNILMTWHQMDPVSQREIDRNNAVYNHQNNRNPFVDHPEYVQLIWNPTPDNEAPSMPTNLVASNPTSSTIDLNWTASTDNVAVTAYDIFMNGTYKGTSTTTSYTANNLLPNLTWCFVVYAKDASGNVSEPSNEDCETTLDGQANLNCVEESFENIPSSSSTYADRVWTGDNGYNFHATDARTDQTLNGRTITVRNGILECTDFVGMLETVTVTTQRVFSGGTGTFDLVVNGDFIATIPYGDNPITTSIPVGIDDFESLVINNNSVPTNRVNFDDLIWTCGLLGTDEFTENQFKIYPNPAKNMLHIDLKNSAETKIEIYNVLGKRVFQKTIQNSDVILLDDLSSGVYIVRLTQDNNSISKKLIKE